MKLSKNRIKVSEAHPSLQLELQPQSILASPVVIDLDGNLVDGYRRFQLAEGDDIEGITMPVESIFHAALELNRRTRLWDSIDCFFWARWARQMGVTEPALPLTRFPEELFSLSDTLLSLLAKRRLTLRQAILLIHAPRRYQDFFQQLFGETILLNDNETAAFIEMVSDLKTILAKTELQDVFLEDSLSRVLGSIDLTPKQRGEQLLKEMRRLRYPYYQKKSDEFSLLWQQLDLGKGVHANKKMFLERGILEITWSASSHEEARERAERLCRSMSSQVWSEIWEE